MPRAVAVGAVNADAEPATKLAALLESDGRFAAVWAHNAPWRCDQSLSGYRHSLTAHLSRAGFNPQEIADALVVFCREHASDAEHCRRNIDRRQIDRKTGVYLIHVPRAAVSVTGAIQPGILADPLTAEFYESGLAARLLLANPPERLKRWTTRRVSAATSGVHERLIESLLGLEHDVGQYGPRPVELPLMSDALPLWGDWYDAHAQREHAATDREAAMLAKLEAAA